MNQTTITADGKRRHVVVMPYPGRGHINPMLNLCNLILTKNNDFLFTFVVTEEWLGFLSSEPKPPANIRYASLPQVIPSEVDRAADIAGFIEAALTKLKDPFERLIDQLEPPPTAIIYDLWLSCWVVEVGNRRNIPVVSLFPMSASVLTFFCHFDLVIQHGHFPIDDISERGSETVDYIPGLPPTTIGDVTTIFELEKQNKKVLQQALQTFSFLKNATCVLLTSIYEFEEQVINHLKQKLPIPVYHIGPMIPYFKNHQLNNHSLSNNNTEYLKWLDAQPKASVLYISQGSFLSISDTQMEEIIGGIRRSGVRFLWVTRGDVSKFEDGGVCENLDGSRFSNTGMTKNLRFVYGEKGCLVHWCDQLKVLSHSSVGGFWTHCGWNSTCESIYAGVPMLTSPIFWDQMPNSKLVVNDLRIGLRAINCGYKKEKLISREDIAEIVKRFMDFESDERKKMVERVKNLQRVFRRAIENGGSAASDIDTFIQSIY